MTKITKSIIVFTIFASYIIFQMIRNTEVFMMRGKWLIDNDYRHVKYTYDEMFFPKVSNYFGLTFPKESDFR